MRSRLGMGAVWGSRSGCLSVLVVPLVVIVAVVSLLVGVAGATTNDPLRRQTTLRFPEGDHSIDRTLCSRRSGVAGVMVLAASREGFSLTVSKLGIGGYGPYGTLEFVGDSTALGTINNEQCFSLRFRQSGPATTYRLKLGVT